MERGGKHPPHKHKVASRSLYKCSLGGYTFPSSSVFFFPTTTSPPPLPPTKDPQLEKPGGRADKRSGLQRRLGWSLTVSHSSTAIPSLALVPVRV